MQAESEYLIEWREKKSKISYFVACVFYFVVFVVCEYVTRIERVSDRERCVRDENLMKANR